MRRSTTEHVVPALTLGAAAALLPFAALLFLSHRHAHFGAQVHFRGVGLTALAAAVAAVALTIVGARRRDGRTVLVGTAFSVMASLLALHGIATPGVLIGMNGVVAFTGGATLPVGAAVLALSALPALRRPRSLRTLLVLQVLLLAAVISLGTIGMLVPSAVPSVPATGSPAALTLLAIGLALFGLLTLRAIRTFLLTRRRADLVVAVGIVWLASALPPAMLLNFMELGWWLGHGFELLGIVVVGVPVALDPVGLPSHGRWWGTSAASTSSPPKRRFSARMSARSPFALPRRTSTPRSTPAAWRSERSRSARSSGSRAGACARWRQAVLFMTSGSSRFPTRFCRSPGR